jgi:phosphoenolpyruvate---glycerone phosphotransferase subunit DhaL
MPITADTLRTGITSIGARLETEHQLLTQLDGKVGDGDLGLTLLKAFRALEPLKATLPADLGQALFQMGSATSKVSSSSFGTLMATAFLAVAKAVKGRDSADWSELSAFITTARQSMEARGKASLGDKTVLDALHAIETAIVGLADPAAELTAARRAVDAALTEFRDKPNKIGRARVYAERTIGVDDPGMMAVKVMLDGLR